MERASPVERAETQPSVRYLHDTSQPCTAMKVSESFVFVYNMAKLRKCSTTFTKLYI